MSSIEVGASVFIRFLGTVGKIVGEASTGSLLIQLPEANGGDTEEIPRSLVERLPVNTRVQINNEAHWYHGRFGLIVGWNDRKSVYLVQREGYHYFDEMDHTAIVALSSLCDLSLATLCTTVVPKMEREFTFVDSQNIRRQYYLTMPEGFRRPGAGNSRVSWPLLVYLHGSAARTFYTYGASDPGSSGIEFVSKHFIVLSPRCNWTAEQSPSGWVLELVHAFRGCAWVDYERVYCAGTSMGGMSVLELAATSPNVFAGIIAAASYHKASMRSHIAWQLRDAPISFFHAARDKTCPRRLEEPL